MSVVDDLVRARQTYESGDWAAAFQAWLEVDAEALTADDLAGLAVAAQLLDRPEICVDALQRSFQLSLDGGGLENAVRCACRLATIFFLSGEPTVGAGWAACAERHAAALPADVVERGYVSLVRMFRHAAVSDFDGAAGCAAGAVEHGHRFGDPGLTAIGLAVQGRMTMYAGRVPEGLALLDEAMATIAPGGGSPVLAGSAYCLMIEGCQEVSDLGRAADWTAALQRWCHDQPGLVAYTGQCAVHRGQIMRAHGAFREAIEEFDGAVERYLASSAPAPAGLALAERGDVLRVLGDLAAAEESYERAAQYGYEAQPGLALLWLAQGRTRAAAAAVRRLLAETTGAVNRSRFLPAATEVLLACDAPDEARQVVRELERTATSFGCDALGAMAAYASGSVELTVGDASGALPYLRKAKGLWAALDCPYELGRARVKIACALRALSDDESAAGELEAARRTFVELGARPAAEEVAALLRPSSLPDGLTAREAEVLRLVASGRSNAQIAAALVLSERTVARHLSNIFTKIGVASRTAAAAYAFERELA